MEQTREKIIIQSEKIADLCYRQKENEAMSEMNGLIDNLMKYMTDLQASDNSEKNDEFNNILGSLLSSIEQKDYVLTADILTYFVIPQVK